MHPADLPGPLVFVDDLGAPALTEEDEHHLRRVLRVRAGEPVIAGDGRGRWRAAVLPADGPLLTDLGDIRQTEAPQPEISIGFALVKGEKADLIVQKLTELGVDRICPFRADRSVVRWDSARAAKATARWRTVARNAAMQCHRPWLPVVEDVSDFGTLARRDGATRADRVAETSGPPRLDRPVVLIGPEGGWADTERELPLPVVSLGEHVLRAETAAITAGALLTALRSSSSPTEGG